MSKKSVKFSEIMVNLLRNSQPYSGKDIKTCQKRHNVGYRIQNTVSQKEMSNFYYYIIYNIIVIILSNSQIKLYSVFCIQAEVYPVSKM